jgi:NADH dehydrogenase
MILVAGGTGLVGSGVVRELLRRGRNVAVLGRSAAKIAEVFAHEPVEARQGDVRDPASLRADLDGVDIIINCVQFPNSPIENKRKGWTFEQVDYQGTLNLLQAAKGSQVRKLVYVSGVGASADAERHWFRLKWAAEEALRMSDLTHVIVRPTWVYGPNDVALNRFLAFAKRLPFVPTFGNGRQEMQPIFIDDLSRILADAAERPDAEDQTFEAGGPDRMSMDDVIKTALSVAGMSKPILHQPIGLGKLLGTLAALLPRPPLTADAVDFITHPAVADNSALERVFAPRLTPLREGLATYLSG